MRQLELAVDEPQRRARRREGPGLYAVVTILRQNGHTIRRRGPGQHLLDGRLVSTRELYFLADRMPLVLGLL